MDIFHIFAALVSFILCVESFDLDKDEPHCLSRFDFDYKVLQKLVTLDQQQKELRETIEKQNNVISQLDNDLKGETVELGRLKNMYRQIQSSFALDGNRATYVRWARKTCPGNGSALVYKGYAAGSHYGDKGGAANFLCLPDEPSWGHFEESLQIGATVFGAEYEFDDRTRSDYFGTDPRDNDVPCVVCETKRSNVLMIPGRNACYAGWTLEYDGYLSAGHTSHSATEFVCLDKNPEILEGGSSNLNGRLFYFAEARCGALPCPPYENGRELTCVVCSK